MAGATHNGVHLGRNRGIYWSTCQPVNHHCYHTEP